MAETELRFFGPLIEVVGAERTTVDFSGPVTASELRTRLYELYPRLEGEFFSIAVDSRLLQEGEVVNRAGEIALLPAFAGG
ncbi:MAG: MoaD/ThiS family protein [bacterium]